MKWDLKRILPVSLFLLFLIALLTASGCKEDEISKLPEAQGGGITSGTIDGIPFTVRSGILTQDIADGPVSAGATGGILIFDLPLSTLIGSTDPEYLMEIFLNDGGMVVALAFGDTSDMFANGLGVGVSRAGSAWSAHFWWGYGGTANDVQAIAPAPNSADPDYLNADYWNGGAPAGLGMTHPDYTPVNCSSPMYWGSSGGGGIQGSGGQGGLVIGNGTVYSLAIVDNFGGC